MAVPVPVPAAVVTAVASVFSVPVALIALVGPVGPVGGAAAAVAVPGAGVLAGAVSGSVPGPFSLSAGELTGVFVRVVTCSPSRPDRQSATTR
ncbi:MAG TPA: hypothetical protein VFP69_15645, partial [Streptomyces sp.]|nr:hypothetical protein [Streptomyces sp.]